MFGPTQHLAQKRQTKYYSKKLLYYLNTLVDVAVIFKNIIIASNG